MSSSFVGLAPVPPSVQRHLSGSALGRQVRSSLTEEGRVESRSAQIGPRVAEPPRPMRLHESTVAEELACFLDLTSPVLGIWLERMTKAINQTFDGDRERTATALDGLDVVRRALEKGEPAAVMVALGKFDDLLYALCPRNVGGAGQR